MQNNILVDLMKELETRQNDEIFLSKMQGFIMGIKVAEQQNTKATV